MGTVTGPQSTQHSKGRHRPPTSIHLRQVGTQPRRQWLWEVLGCEGHTRGVCPKAAQTWQVLEVSKEAEMSLQAGKSWREQVANTRPQTSPARAWVEFLEAWAGEALSWSH